MANIHLSNAGKLNIISNLATMLGAGIPLLESIDTILEEAKGAQKKVLQTLKDDVSQGKKISESFARFPETFDPVTINLIGAAEQSGTLDATLKDIIINIKKEMEFRSKIQSAMVYPAFVLVVFFGVLLLILTFVVPRIADVFSHLSVKLPLMTRILIWTSHFFLSHIPHVIIGLIVIVTTVVILYKKKRQFFLNLIFSLPGFSGLAKEIDLTRFSRSFALLLNAGIPIFSALELAEKVVVKKELKMMVRTAKETVAGGKKLSEAFHTYKKILPGVMVRMTQAGEKSGSLAKSMQDLSEYFDERVSKKVKTMTTLLEPVMLVVIGVMVGGMMLSIVAPIYSLVGSISVR